MTTTATHRPETTSTPESQDLAKLEAMLDEPALIGFRAEILAAIEQLTGGREEE